MKKIKKEELELMSYSDIADILVKEEGAMSTADLFKKICGLLELSDKTFENKIGDFYTALTTDKRFILLEDGNWDLKANHSVSKLKLDETFDDDDEEIEENNDDEEETDEEDDIYDEVSEDDDDDIDEYKDLVIVDEEELESGEE